MPINRTPCPNKPVQADETTVWKLVKGKTCGQSEGYRAGQLRPLPPTAARRAA
jgi:hypothetical protein